MALHLLLASASIVGTLHAADASLVPASRPQLISCDPASKTPCFRLRLNILDGSRQPLALQLPNPTNLARSLVVNVNGQDIVPFYADAGSTSASNIPRTRIALVLIDVSGSMNRSLATGQTRFEAARKAAQRFLDGFVDGVDQVAFVPFQSRDVVQTIENAKFATSKADAEQQISLLPAPQAKNNTALYSAVVAGVDLLKRAIGSLGRPADALMITMTDGENDVGGRSDDPGLLTGEQGLESAQARVQNAGLESITIGFGDRDSIDQRALQLLGTKTYMAQGVDELERAFGTTRTLLNDRLTLTFSSPSSDRASLAGQTLTMNVALRLPAGVTVRSIPIIWTTPQLGVPPYEGRCEAPETAAVLRTTAAEVTGWGTVVRPLIIVLSYSALFLILWFWVPQLIWPGREIAGLHSIHHRRRWSNTPARTSVRRPVVNTPVGFGSNDGPPLSPRNPADATVIHVPASDTSRSRLFPMFKGRR
jgi:hypothetical protein